MAESIENGSASHEKAEYLSTPSADMKSTAPRAP
jgi:hypothetical protein